MKSQKRLLGIDIGSVSISMVEMDCDRKIISSKYIQHYGKIRDNLLSLLNKIDINNIGGITCTSSTPPILKNAFRCDSQVAVIEAVKHYCGTVGSILVVGAEKFGLILFNGDGTYRKLRTNSSCAAGTGSFLDQQARRLNLKDAAELSETALKNTGDIPVIASRCAVFAKTDLIHAQQEGYSIEAVCDGLCLGLAKNITDTLFAGDEIRTPVLIAGGVSLNRAVIKHLKSLLSTSFIVHEYAHIFGAIGACFSYLQDNEIVMESSFNSVQDIILPEEKKKEYFYEPLELKLSVYPEFTSEKSYRFTPAVTKTNNGTVSPVEVDIYTRIKPESTFSVYMGIDIGSTSTKAMIIDEQLSVIAGFYTKTSGKPLIAVQAIFEAIDNIKNEYSLTLNFLGTGTTGSGRKFIGRIIGADLILNEITAHAKAAYHLDPEIDTIIEIGGQDAKFTTMKNGTVTFSQMNNVCAAGTGSFIEEQADRLRCPLQQYSAKAEGVLSPLASDRCTVFMERDINHYLNKDYSVNEILAAALFSVRENYLQKVARKAGIGSKICFQGATAKNRALVAAFEQKLGKPIFVSKYCHLTGAMGVALLLSEGELTEYRLTEEEKYSYTPLFKGLDIYKETIPIESEMCNLCNNYCRLRVAAVKNEKVAYGFLCGRDYNVHKFVNTNKSGFNLIGARKKIFSAIPEEEEILEYSAANAGLLNLKRYLPNIELQGIKELLMHSGRSTAPDRKPQLQYSLKKPGISIGIPAGLHLFDDLQLWKNFFTELYIKTVTSEKFKDPIKTGKEITGAEFCAPVTALHGHVKHLAGKVDYIFIPYYLQARERPADAERLYCYYTQFSPALVSGIEERLRRRCIMPLINQKGGYHNSIEQLYKALKPVLGSLITINKIGKAYEKALTINRIHKEKLKKLFLEEKERINDFAVVFIGRPYTILSPAMNKGIPEIFASLGVKTFYQDMIPCRGSETEDIEPLLKVFPWHYASKMLETAKVVSETDSLYPVIITSFKCSPDSFVTEYLKRIFDKKGKPYLILQIDEHDSNAGYETRVEAGIRAFRNHKFSGKDQKSAPVLSGSLNADASGKNGTHLTINPVIETTISGKTLLMPVWDPLSMPLLVANLRREGIDARMLNEDYLSIQKSMKLNTGQCIPLNIIAQETIDYIEKNNLDPSKTLLWMVKADLPCNYPMYPYFIKSLLEAHSKEMGKTGVYVGELSHFEISVHTSVNAYFAYMFGGMLRKLGCKIRPYEINKGETDRVIKSSIPILERAFLGEISKDDALSEVIDRFDAVERIKTYRPKVAIFGDMYVRDNDVMNQGLIYAIEDAGGEVITTPYNEYVKIIADAYFREWFRDGKYFDLIKNKPLLASMKIFEQRYYHYFEKYTGPMADFNGRRSEEELNTFGVLLEHTGESYDNILKIFHIIRNHPDISLFVQANPSYCCPSLVTEAMAREIEKVTGIPVLTLEYDGTTEYKNDIIAPYLRYPLKRETASPFIA
ncbi:MAG: CoA activase [Spirochaetes bacterium]|nr:CoA activase [Spirochaetota bacterium]